MTTTVATIDNTAWTDLGAGAVYVEAATRSEGAAANQVPLNTDKFEPDIVYHIGASSPTLGTFAYHTFKGELNYTGTQHVYVKTLSGRKTIKYTPIS